MPFKTVAKLGKKKTDVLRNIPDVQERKDVCDIVLEVLKGRRTIRDFQDKEISDEILIKILDAARYAPSAGNQQPWEFIIVKQPETRKKLSVACYEQECTISAPVLIVVCINTHLASAKFKERGEKLYGIQGVAAATENMLIAAESLGIGSAWIGAFSEKTVAIMTQCPDHVRPCAVIALGYPAEEPPMPHRQPLIDIIHFERFGETYLTKELYGSKELF